MAPAGGGSLILAWQLKGKQVLLVGGGTVAHGRLLLLLETDAEIILVAPKSELHPSIKALLADPPTARRITYFDAKFSPKHLLGVDLVLTAIHEHETSKEIYALAKKARIPVNVADVPPLCDFYFGSMIRRGALQIMVSTNGRGPKMSNIIRTKVEESLPKSAEDAIENVGKLREKLRALAPGVGGALGRTRMKWMTNVCETWTIGELAMMDDATMDRLLEDGWRLGKVPTYKEINGWASSVTVKAKRVGDHVASAAWPLTIGFTLGALTCWALRRQ